jgi:hypothetical protein
MILMRLMMAAWNLHGGARGVVQHAVDAVPDGQASLVGLDVDVAGPLVDRFEEDLVDQLDHAGLLGHLQQVIVVLGVVADDLQVVGAHHLVERLAADAEMRLDELLDVLLGRQGRLNLQARQQADLVEGVEVERVAGGHDQHAVVSLDRQDSLAVYEPRRQGAKGLQVDLHVGQVDHRRAELLAHDPQQVLLLDAVELDQRPIQANALGLAKLHRGREMIGGDQPPFEQYFRDTHGCAS